jgi:hypothetical protein
MKNKKWVVSFVLVTLGVTAAVVDPGESRAQGQQLAPANNQVRPLAKANVTLTRVKPSTAETTAAKAHNFGLVAGATVALDEQTDRAPLIKKPTVVPRNTTPKLNIGKFGETVHAALKDKVRGYALGLRKNGQHVLTLIWDWSKTPQEGGQGWTLDTRMHVASVSKLMTAFVAVKALHDSGRSFDTQIGAFLPAYWDAPSRSQQVTFRNLLTHRGGFTNHDGDYKSFKQQVEQGISANSSYKYTNGSFSLVRVLTSTMTGAVNPNLYYEFPFTEEALNDALWDSKTQQAFLNYAQSKVFTPSGVANVSAAPGTVGAYGYSGKTDTKGWNSGNVSGQLGGAGFRLSVNDLLNVMGTFRRKGTIVPASKAKEAIEAGLGIDQIITTPAGTIYNKNGRWQNGSTASADTEQSLVYFMPEDIELAVLVNSWIGTEQASLRGTITNAYLANLE